MKGIEDLNPHGYEMTDSVKKNLGILSERLLELQDAYIDAGGSAFIITSGLRSEADQAALRAQGKTRAVHSKHLSGWAADIYDPKKKLQKFLKENPAVLERIGIWCEDFGSTPNWVHCQATPPGSGKRFFIP